MMHDESILKVHLIQGRSSGSRGNIEIKIASYDNRELRTVPLHIIESLGKLSATQASVAFAFEVKIVSDHHLARDVSLHNEGQSSSQSFLKGTDFRNEPVRLPEV